jgi:PTS system mannose-specific IIA component
MAGKRVQPTMARLLIVAHAPLASALRSVALHAFGDRSGEIAALDVPAAMPPDQALARGTALLDELGSGEILILTDVFGATPSNVAQRLADGARVRVVTGVNVPMLWRALTYSQESVEALVERALAGAHQGLMQVGGARPQHQTHAARDNKNAQGDSHHQQ